MAELITPSSLWQGTEVAGSRWTVQQLSVLAKEAADPERVRTVTIMRRPAVNAVDWTMPPQAVPVVLPCLVHSRNGRALVVTPAGAKQWMEVARG